MSSTKNHKQSGAESATKPAAADKLQKQESDVPSPDAVPSPETENQFPPLPPLPPNYFGDEYNFGDPSSQMNWFGMSQPFFNRGVPHLRMGENSGVEEQWMRTYQMGQVLGLGADTSSWLSNTLTPTAIDSALKGDYPTMGEQISYELGSSPIMLPIPGIHFKLEVGESDDPLEREADAVADRVMKMDETFVQRKCAECEEEEKLQRKVEEEEEELQTKPLVQLKAGDKSDGAEVQPWIESQIKQSRGGGQPLHPETRSFMETSMGSDFGEVRVHTGSPAVQMNKELGAKAFTVGSDIYFNKGQYQPGSGEGKELLAHELTHTVQQGQAKKLQRTESVGTTEIWDEIRAYCTAAYNFLGEFHDQYQAGMSMFTTQLSNESAEEAEPQVLSKMAEAGFTEGVKQMLGLVGGAVAAGATATGIGIGIGITIAVVTAAIDELKRAEAARERSTLADFIVRNLRDVSGAIGRLRNYFELESGNDDTSPAFFDLYGYAGELNSDEQVANFGEDLSMASHQLTRNTPDANGIARSLGEAFFQFNVTHDFLGSEIFSGVLKLHYNVNEGATAATLNNATLAGPLASRIKALLMNTESDEDLATLDTAGLNITRIIELEQSRFMVESHILSPGRDSVGDGAFGWFNNLVGELPKVPFSQIETAASTY